jgi:hypothetical protein
MNFILLQFYTIQSGLPPFAEAKTGRKIIRIPPLIITKKIISQFCKQYTYLTNLKVYLMFDFSSFNISLLYFTESQKKE